MGVRADNTFVTNHRHQRHDDGSGPLPAVNYDAQDAWQEDALFQRIPLVSASLHGSLAGIWVFSLSRRNTPAWFKIAAGTAGIAAATYAHRHATKSALEHLYWGAEGAEAQFHRLVDEETGRST